MPDHSPGRPSRTGGTGAGRRRAVTASLALAAGAGLLAVATLLWQRAQPSQNTGVAAVTALSHATATPPAEPMPDSVPVHAATLPTAVAVDRPVQVRVDRLRISAEVVPVGVDSAGNVVIPRSVDTVGWYRFGAGLGAAGSVVITGHVDSAAQGDGAFARLRDAKPPDLVHVTGSSGHDTVFHVVGREEYPKSTIKLGRYFTVAGPSRLTLITCGGPFDSRTGHYRDNVVVTAVPGTAPEG